MNGETDKILAALKEWQKGVDDKLNHITETLDDAFKPEGFCTRARSKVSNVVTALTIYGLLIVGIIIAIITQAIKK